MTLNYLWDWFKQLKFGRHVIHINKQQLKSVDSMNFFYFRTHASKAMIKHDPLLFNDFDDFSNVKNVGKFTKIKKKTISTNSLYG